MESHSNRAARPKKIYLGYPSYYNTLFWYLPIKSVVYRVNVYQYVLNFNA